MILIISTPSTSTGMCEVLLGRVGVDLPSFEEPDTVGAPPKEDPVLLVRVFVRVFVFVLVFVCIPFYDAKNRFRTAFRLSLELRADLLESEIGSYGRTFGVVGGSRPGLSTPWCATDLRDESAASPCTPSPTSSCSNSKSRVEEEVVGCSGEISSLIRRLPEGVAWIWSRDRSSCRCPPVPLIDCRTRGARWVS